MPTTYLIDYIEINVEFTRGSGPRSLQCAEIVCKKCRVDQGAAAWSAQRAVSLIVGGNGSNITTRMLASAWHEAT